MKRILLIGLVLSTLTLSAQSNGIDVRNFTNPMRGFNYDSAAVEDITVRFRNDGPNILFAQDSIYFSLSIATKDTTEFYDIKKRIDQTLMQGDLKDYTLISNYGFKQENDYVICATANGTNIYPTNSTKNPRACVSFVVNIEKHELKLNSVNYTEGILRINSDANEYADLLILDITGRVLKQSSIFLSQSFELKFSPPANGFYFLKVKTKNGQSSIAKFVVN